MIMDKYTYGENTRICQETAQQNGFLFLNKVMNERCYGPTPSQLFDNLQATFVHREIAQDLKKILKQIIARERARVYGKDTAPLEPLAF